MIGRKSEEVFSRAAEYAMENKHEFCTLEHILWALLEVGEIGEILSALKVDVEELREELEAHIEKEVPKNAKMGEEGMAPMATLSVQRVMQQALFHVQSSGKREVLPVDLLVGIFQAKDTFAFLALKKRGLERLDVLNFLSHGELPVERGQTLPEETELRGDREARGNPDEDILKEFARNLNQEAKAGQLDPLIGREVEMDRVLQVLCRRRKNNPLLVGEAGVGKTALAEGLASRIVDGQVPSLLKNAEVFEVDLGGMLAGTKFRGDFENRIKKIFQALQRRAEKGARPIVFIDEIHTLVGAGSTGGGTLDAANLLKPILGQGKVRMMGATTYTEYRSTFEKDAALNRRFQKIDVPETSLSETQTILKGLKEQFESHHELKFDDSALQAAVELSAKYITDRFLPDKAIDVIDEAGARARLRNQKVVDVALIEEVVSQIARVPVKAVVDDAREKLKTLDRDLRLAIFGQNTAIDAIVSAIRLSRSGLRSGEKPVGSFLFAGPTGVGKTELARQLAFLLGIPLLRFDMSEYMEKHSVSRLIGAPPGYVGFEQAGVLTEALRKQPHAVVLLDEFEKAHPDVWNILLQVMDHGALTDNLGRKVDFKHAMIILTSNVGAREATKKGLGLVKAGNSSDRVQSEMERVFSPEFRNRLDAIVYFESLSRDTMEHVLRKQMVELETQLLAKGVELSYDEKARALLIDKGFDEKLGARPLARVISQELRKPLSEEILFGKLQKGGSVQITAVDEKLVLTVLPPKPSSSSRLGTAGEVVHSHDEK